MRKKFLYLGILLVIVGIIVAFASPGFALPSQFTNPISQMLTINASMLGYMPLQLNESGLVVMMFNASAPVDFYLANTAAFLQIENKSVANSSARSEAVGLEGNGVYELYEGSGNGIFPYTTLAGITKPNYLQNVSTLKSGTYYAVFANSGSQNALIQLTMLPVSTAQLQSSTSSLGIYFGAAFVVFIVGVGLIIFSFLSKGGKNKDDEMDKQVAEQYDIIDGQGKKSK